MLAVAACSGDSPGVVGDSDAGGGGGGTDSGAIDSGASNKDAGGTPTDSGTTPKDSGPTGDSGTPDYPCQFSLPTTAAATLTLAGGVVEQGLGTQSAAAGAAIDAYGTQTSTTSIANTTSDASGDFSLDIPTGGAPVDGYLKITKTGDLDTFLYPNFPLTTDQSKLAGILITQATFNTLAGFVTVTQDSTKGFTAVEVLDCAGNSASGATVTTSAGGTTKYNGAANIPSSTATTTGADGIAYVFNMTAGDATIMVSIGGKPYRTHHVFTRAGTFTITLATP